jgi:hypothetical protein
LRELLEMIGVNVIPEQFAIPRAFEAFDGNGALRRPEDRAGLARMASDLAQAMSAKPGTSRQMDTQIAQ